MPSVSVSEIGVLFWTWLGLMNPHKLTWGFALNFPFAQIVGLVTFVGVLFSREPKRFPVTGVTVVLLMFLSWQLITTVFALYPESAWSLLSKSFKIQAGVVNVEDNSGPSFLGLDHVKLDLSPSSNQPPEGTLTTPLPAAAWAGSSLIGALGILRIARSRRQPG